MAVKAEPTRRVEVRASVVDHAVVVEAAVVRTAAAADAGGNSIHDPPYS
jgi:hypothetical protein